MKQRSIAVPVEVYSRVVGYYRPINQWNKGKQEEFHERKEYSVSSLKDPIVYEYQRIS